MEKPISVLVWGPGGLGKICIREVLRLPEFALAGVLAYSEGNDGADAGTVAGTAPCGVQATTDLASALAIDCDVVIHLSRDFGRFDALDSIAAFLRAGRNVITVHPYHHVEAFDSTAAPANTRQIIESACIAGGSTFHATGIHPEMIADRMAATLTGLCTDVRNIKVFENWDMGQFNEATLRAIGFGKSPESMESNPAVAQMTDNYCLQNLYGLASGLGVELSRTSISHEYATAPEELTFDSITIGAGTVGRLTHTWNGFCAGSVDPLITLEVNWMMGRAEMVPPGMDPDHYYGVIIEGTPSVRMGISISGSFERGQHLVDPSNPASEPGYYGAVATCLQAVPRTIASASGILGPSRPDLHWAPDLRSLSRP